MINIRIRNDDHEVDIRFPISESELYAKLAEIHAIDGRDAPPSAFVTEVYWPEELSMLKDRFANLDELNYLAKRMESFDYNEYDQFLIGITKLDSKEVKDLINLTFNLDHFTLCKDVSSYGKIGREYVLNTEGTVPANDEDDPKYVYIEDGDTGDFILDTWHKTLGNVSEFSQRTMVSGYRFETALEDMSRGLGGQIGFVSKTTGNVLLMHYEPLGLNNWNVIVTVEDKYALADSQAVNAKLYRMAAVIAVSLLVYIACVTLCLLGAYRQVKRVAVTDQSTGVRNRNSYDSYVAEAQNKLFESIACVYVDVNGLHRVNNERGHREGDLMLRAVADAMKLEFDSSALFRIGGDEFVAFSEQEDEAACLEKMVRVAQEIESKGYSISYGVIRRQNETGLEQIIRDTDELMLENKKQYYSTFGNR